MTTNSTQPAPDSGMTITLPWARVGDNVQCWCGRFAKAVQQGTVLVLADHEHEHEDGTTI